MSELNDWDYDFDLKLLRVKLSAASGKEKQELHDLIQRVICGVKENNSMSQNSYTRQLLVTGPSLHLRSNGHVGFYGNSKSNTAEIKSKKFRRGYLLLRHFNGRVTVRVVLNH